jgi:hypothetical protein
VPLAADLHSDLRPDRAQSSAAGLLFLGKQERGAMDLCQLKFGDNTLDTVVTACTFCQVPKPVVGLRDVCCGYKL